MWDKLERVGMLIAVNISVFTIETVPSLHTDAQCPDYPLVYAHQLEGSINNVTLAMSTGLTYNPEEERQMKPGQGLPGWGTRN